VRSEAGVAEFNVIIDVMDKVRGYVMVLQKLWDNVFSPRVISILGFRRYLIYLQKFLENLNEIKKCGDLRPLDKAMGEVGVKQFWYRGNSFYFDCKFCDDILKEESFAFGVAREIYIRDCYFKWHDRSVYENSKVVIDLGANRGAFASLMTTRADFILCVECNKNYVPVIEYNMKLNNYNNYVIDSSFIGAGGMLNAKGVGMSDLFLRYNIKKANLVKLDIEGSEFSVFEDCRWLHRVEALSMEVHRDYGNPYEIISALSRVGFIVKAADENLRLLNVETNQEDVAFIYARKK